MSFYCYLGHFYHFVFWYTLILFIYFIIWKSNVTFLTTFHFSLFQKLLIFLSIKNFSSSSLSKASHFPIYQQPTSPSLKSVRILMYLKLSPFSLIPFCLFEIQTSILTLFFSFSLSHTYIYIYIYIHTLILIFFSIFSGFVSIVPSSLRTLRFCIGLQLLSSKAWSLIHWLN